MYLILEANQWRPCKAPDQDTQDTAACGSWRLAKYLSHDIHDSFPLSPSCIMPSSIVLLACALVAQLVAAQSSITPLFQKRIPYTGIPYQARPPHSFHPETLMSMQPLTRFIHAQVDTDSG